MQNLSGKVALVTGASRGLGRALALALGSTGCDVAATDLLVEEKEPDRAELAEYSPTAAKLVDQGCVYTEQVANEIRKMGSKSLVFKMDVRSSDEIREVVGRVEKSLGTVDILVNNAALMDNFGRFEEQDPVRWERDIRVNLTGAFLCSKTVWPGMVKKKWGRIINISSIAGLMGAFGQPSYGASKAGLIGLTRSLALEGARAGITVNAVLPGLIETEAVKLHKPEFLERMKNRAAMRRLGRPEEVAATVAFLASHMAGYITGAAIPVTGGADLYTF